MSLFNSTYKSIDINEIDEILDKIELIDIREPHEFKASHIRTAKNIPMSDLLNMPEKFLKKDKEYYIMCRAGHRSATAYKELSSKGFNVYDVTSGMDFYEGENRI